MKTGSRKSRGSFGGFVIKTLFRLVIFVIVLLLLAFLVLDFIPVGFFVTEKADEQLSPSPKLSSDRLNVLLIGADAMNDGMQRSDTMMIASIGGGSLHLASVLRDTTLEIPGHGAGKLNAAYVYGGAPLTVRTINENFALNITRWVKVDFSSVAEIINAMGGVDIAITESEQSEINRNVRSSWKYFKKLGYDRSATGMLSYSFADADAEGKKIVHLDGFQALGYARIRRTDSDFTRAFRQRKLINACLNKLKANKANLPMLINTAKTVFDSIETDMNAFEILSIAAKCLTGGDIEQMRIPVDGSYTDNGSALIDINCPANLTAFLDFIYDR